MRSRCETRDGPPVFCLPMPSHSTAVAPPAAAQRARAGLGRQVYAGQRKPGGCSLTKGLVSSISSSPFSKVFSQLCEEGQQGGTLRARQRGQRSAGLGGGHCRLGNRPRACIPCAQRGTTQQQRVSLSTEQGRKRALLVGWLVANQISELDGSLRAQAPSSTVTVACQAAMRAHSAVTRSNLPEAQAKPLLTVWGRPAQNPPGRSLRCARVAASSGLSAERRAASTASSRLSARGSSRQADRGVALSSGPAVHLTAQQSMQLCAALLPSPLVCSWVQCPMRFPCTA